MNGLLVHVLLPFVASFNIWRPVNFPATDPETTKCWKYLGRMVKPSAITSPALAMRNAIFSETSGAYSGEDCVKRQCEKLSEIISIFDPEVSEEYIEGEKAQTAQKTKHAIGDD